MLYNKLARVERKPIRHDPNNIVVYSDGACRGNPGKGGWGVYIELPDNTEQRLYGGQHNTTNQKMELTAAVQALELLIAMPDFDSLKAAIEIVTDSKYVVNGMKEWIHKWKKNGWIGSNGREVSNLDLWQRLAKAAAGVSAKWTWVKGHNGHPGNEVADALANRGIDELPHISKFKSRLRVGDEEEE